MNRLQNQIAGCLKLKAFNPYILAAASVREKKNEWMAIIVGLNTGETEVQRSGQVCQDQRELKKRLEEEREKEKEKRQQESESVVKMEEVCSVLLSWEKIKTKQSEYGNFPQHEHTWHKSRASLTHKESRRDYVI